VNKITRLFLVFLLLIGCTSKKDNYRIEKFIFLSYRHNDPVPLNDYTIIDSVMKPNLHVKNYFEITGMNNARISKGIAKTLFSSVYDSITIEDSLIRLIDSILYDKKYEYAYFESGIDRDVRDITGYTIIYQFKGQKEKTINYYCTKLLPPSLLKLHEELLKVCNTYIDTPVPAFNYNVDLKKINQNYEHYMGFGPPEATVIQRRRIHTQ